MRDLFAYKALATNAGAADEAGNAAYALANLYHNQLGDDDLALEYYQLAMDTRISGAGSAVRSHARMAAVDILGSRGKFDAAIQLLDEYDDSARHAYWKMPELMARAAIAVDQGNTDAARAYYHQALAIDSLSNAERKRLQDMLATVSK